MYCNKRCFSLDNSRLPPHKKKKKIAFDFRSRPTRVTKNIVAPTLRFRIPGQVFGGRQHLFRVQHARQPFPGRRPEHGHHQSRVVFVRHVGWVHCSERDWQRRRNAVDGRTDGKPGDPSGDSAAQRGSRRSHPLITQFE